MTKELVIKITGLADVYNFIAEATKVEGDIVIKRGKFVIDAKSIMGIFSIDMSNPVTVIYPADANEFDKYIQQFVA